MACGDKGEKGLEADSGLEGGDSGEAGDTVGKEGLSFFRLGGGIL